MPKLLLKGDRVVFELENGATFAVSNKKDHIEIRIEEGPYNDAGHHTLHSVIAFVPQATNEADIRSIDR